MREKSQPSVDWRLARFRFGIADTWDSVHLSIRIIEDCFSKNLQLNINMESVYSMLNSLEEENLATTPTNEAMPMPPLIPQPGTVEYVKRHHMKDITETTHITTRDVDFSVRIMDLKYNTSFYEWIRNADNVDFIAHHLKRIVMDHPTEKVSLGLRWLISDWSVSAIASLLIKIYYEHGLNDQRFTSVVSDLCNGTPWIQVIDLLATLIIGEDPSMTAKFIYAVTDTWQPATIVDLMLAVSGRSRWKNEFMESFIAHYASLNTRMPLHERVARVTDIQRKFTERASGLERLPHEKSHVAIPGHRVFARLVFETVVLEDSRVASGRVGTKQPVTVSSVPVSLQVQIPSHSDASSPVSSLTSPVKSPNYHHQQYL